MSVKECVAAGVRTGPLRPKMSGSRSEFWRGNSEVTVQSFAVPSDLLNRLIWKTFLALVAGEVSRKL